MNNSDTGKKTATLEKTSAILEKQQGIALLDTIIFWHNGGPPN